MFKNIAVEMLMEWKSAAMLLPLLVIGCATKHGATNVAQTPATHSTSPTTAPTNDRWRLIWSDEFDRDGLPDPTKWKPENGFLRNNEPQYYTENRLENARVEGGMLILEARKERWKNAKYAPDAKLPRNRSEFADYTSASIITKGLFQFRYGRVEMRAQLPEVDGTWPAMWALGANIDQVKWPACGEIDIMEWWGHRPRRMTSSLHFEKSSKHQQHTSATTQPAAITGFHVYAMEWTPEQIEFFYDGVGYHRVKLDKLDDHDAFQAPHYLLLNLALDPNHQIEDAALPQTFKVDYLRVYEAKK